MGIESDQICPTSYWNRQPEKKQNNDWFQIIVAFENAEKGPQFILVFLHDFGHKFCLLKKKQFSAFSTCS